MDVNIYAQYARMCLYISYSDVIPTRKEYQQHDIFLFCK